MIREAKTSVRFNGGAAASNAAVNFWANNTF